MGIDAVILDDQATKLGAVETWEHAKRCAELFRANRDRISGVVVSLPNFGDEKGVADTLKLAGLNVPVLVQAYPDDLGQLSVERRRDAFCGKISVCNNLRQYGIPFSLTEDHTIHPLSDEFRHDLAGFVAQCRVVAGMRRARIGAVGARPNAFNTTRYSEKLLQSAGISVATMDLSDLFGRAGPCRRRRWACEGEDRRNHGLRDGSASPRLRAYPHGQTRGRAARLDGSKTTWTPRRFNAGVRCSKTSASTSVL